MSTADELERLAKLRSEGVLTEDEFLVLKQRVVGNADPVDDTVAAGETCSPGFNTLAELRKLRDQLENGELSREEYGLQQARVLGGRPPLDETDGSPAAARRRRHEETSNQSSANPAIMCDIVVTVQPDDWGGNVTKAETYARELVNSAQTRWDVDVVRKGQRWLLRPHNEADTQAIEEFVRSQRTQAIDNLRSHAPPVEPSDAAPFEPAKRRTFTRYPSEKKTWSEWLNSLDKVKSFGVILHCPRCGSDQLREIRSPKGIVVAGVFAPKTRVECKMCGNRAYKSALRRA